MTALVIAHDVGTSGNKASIVDSEGHVLATAVAHYPVLYSEPGWAEQDPERHWWQAVCKTTRDVVERSGMRPADISAITFATQMMGVIPVDKTGTPLMNCMTWLDTRAARQNRDIARSPIRMLRMLRITGGIPSGKDSIGKILWVKQMRPEIFEKTHKFLDCKDYLIYRCTGEYVTSFDCASVTWFMDSRNDRWSSTILGWMGLDEDRLPELRASTHVIGTLTADAASQLGLTTQTQVVNGAGDMTAAAVGSGAVRERQVHLYAGSSAWLGAHVKERKLDIFTYTGSIKSAIPGLFFMVAEQESAGACLKHLREQMHCNLCQYITDLASPRCRECIEGRQNPYKTLDEVAVLAPAGSDGLLFAPWLFGERSPLNDHTVRGGYFNLSLSHEKRHMVRAVMEGVAYHTRWMFDGIQKRRMLGRVDRVNMIGGCANSDLWPQIFADVLEVPVHRMANPLEAGSIGVAMVAMVGIGEIPDFETAAERISVDRVFEPNPDNMPKYRHLFRLMKDYYRRNKSLWRRTNASHAE